MAKEAVVGASNDPFFAAVVRVVKRLENAQGPLYAAILVHLPERPSNDWVFLAGSQRLSKDRFEGIRAIAKAMKGTIPTEYATRIRRVDILRTDDPIYIRLSRGFNVLPGAAVELFSCEVFELEIGHAVLFAMRPAGTNQRLTRTKKRKRRSRAAQT